MTSTAPAENVTEHEITNVAPEPTPVPTRGIAARNQAAALAAANRAKAIAAAKARKTSTNPIARIEAIEAVLGI